jgi:hypothetical protein
VKIDFTAKIRFFATLAKVGFSTEIDFVAKEPFFTTFVYYGSENGILSENTFYYN